MAHAATRLIVVVCAVAVAAAQLEENPRLAVPGPVYGHILRSFLDDLDPATPDCQAALAEALRFMAARQQVSAAPAAAAPVVLLLGKQVLRHTQDDVTTTVYRFQDNYGRAQARQVILGINYHLDLEWPAAARSPRTSWAAAAARLVHRLVVTRDRNNAYAVLSHTLASLPVVGCDVAAARLLVTLDGDGVWRSVQPETLPALDASVAHCYGLTHRPTLRGFVAALYPRPAPTGSRAASSARVLLPPFAAQPFPPARAASRRRTSRRQIRVASWNIWNINRFDDGDYEARRDKLVRQLNEQNADIIALQEVRHDTMRDSQARSLALRLPGYHFVFQPAMSYPERVFNRVEEGCAVFSRFPIESHDYLLLPRNRDDESDVHQRVVFRVGIRTPHGLLQVLVSHFALSEASRDVAVVALWDWIRAQPGPQLFVGDLNAEPDTPAMQFLDNGRATIAGVTPHGIYDSWLLKHPEPRVVYPELEEIESAGDEASGRWLGGLRDPGLTFNTRTPGGKLVKRIDYAFLRPQNQLVLDDIATFPSWSERDSNPASDHLGLVLDFTFK